MGARRARRNSVFDIATTFIELPADNIDIVEVDAFARPRLIYHVLMKLRLVVEHDSETKRWAAFFPELPGCASAGDTEDEAIQNAKEALELWFEPTPVDLPAGAKVLEVALK